MSSRVKKKRIILAISPRHRAAFAGIGLLVVSFGTATLASGHLHYFNYWGAAVFAPLSILVGLMLFAVGLLARKKKAL